MKLSGRAFAPTRAPAPVARPSARRVAVRAEAPAAAAPPADAPALFSELADVLDDYRRAPITFKNEVSKDVTAVTRKLAAAGALPKWGAAQADPVARRPVSLGELRLVGVKRPEAIAEVSIRNDAAFLFSVGATTSISAVVLGQLPGDWGFFSSYLVGSISFVVLGIGSVNPGILQFAIDSFSQIFPDYKERVLRHEAAHFLTAYLLGCAVGGYSLLLGKEHTDLAEAVLQRRLIEQTLDNDAVDRLSIIAVAGATAEAMNYEEVMGQNADLSDLQRIMLRSANKMNNGAQQAQTRWAAYQAASLLRAYAKEYEALQAAMARGAPVQDCIKAIEAA